MAPGCFSGLWCFRQSPCPSDDGIVPPVLAPAGATQPTMPPPGDGGVRDAAAIEITRTRSLPSPGNVDIPDPASTEDSLPGSTGAPTSALTEAQPTGQHSSEGNVNIPVLAHAEEDHSAPPTSRPTYGLDPEKAKGHIDHIPRFRVLVMGRANAGKTTILQRVCDTTDQPEIFNGEGQKVDATVVQGSLTRGLHNIEDELVFRSNPRFVFHDSRGFEAGSEEQFELMKKFVLDRAKTTKLNERIHAIWFCIPLTDSHRLVMAAEKKFFEECDTGHVPVIVLLTKADTLSLDAIQVLIDKDENIDDAMKGAAEEERRIVDDCLLRVEGWLKDQTFPPHDYLTLSRMQQDGEGCTSLLTCTAHALTEEGLQQLLLSTQQSNLELCMTFAIMKTLKKCLSRHWDKITPTNLSCVLAPWFPFDNLIRDDRGQESTRLGLFNRDEFFELYINRDDNAELLGLRFETMDASLVPSICHHPQSLKMPKLFTTMTNSTLYVAEHGIGSILVFEYLYFLLQARDDQDGLQEHLTLAVERYQSSGVHDKVNMLIQEAFQKYGEDVETLSPILVCIAKENQLSKMLNEDGTI